MHCRFLIRLFTSAAFFVGSITFAGDCPSEKVVQLQRRWEQINYQTSEDLKEFQFEQLVNQADSADTLFPQCADILIWQGIIKSTYAGVSGGLSALGMVKEARASLEKAIEIDATALHGSAYTSLGALYYQVPGWPIGFGNSKKARSYLEKAIAMNPDGIDANFFYAEYLVEEREYEKAEVILHKALNASPRPGRKIADEGRKQEIHLLLASLREKI